MAPFFGFGCKAALSRIGCNLAVVKTPLCLKHQVSSNNHFQRLPFCTRAVQWVPYCPRTVFENWCQVFGKTYPSDAEKEYRFLVFAKEYEDVLRSNASNPRRSYTVSVNSFSDLTHSEFLGFDSRSKEDDYDYDDEFFVPYSDVVPQKPSESLVGFDFPSLTGVDYEEDLAHSDFPSLEPGVAYEEDEEDLPLTEALPHNGSYDGKVIPIDFMREWEYHFKKGVESKKLVVINFMAIWCIPCKTIAPIVDKIAKNSTHVIFHEVEVDELKSVADKFKVDYLPTFLLLKEGNEVDRVVGAYEEDLQAKITKHGALAV